tara:strand:- start:2190 stop:2789 length:600 start_codon:yes stop_codon:yes gene_type:complete
MRHVIYLLIVVCMPKISFSQKTEIEITELRNDHKLLLIDSTKKMLTPEEIKEFQGLDYFEIDSKFQIEARFKKKKGKKFEMATSTDRKPIYRRYGYLYFTLDSIECKLEVYQNIALKENPEYKNYLFIPFKDGTSALSTYGGGRFMDVEKTKEKTFILDFNLAYNPYCAYSYRYSCPIPPRCNTLNVDIKAGEKTPIGH